MRGFTLLEMLVAMAIMALIAVLSYTALAQGGDGFRLLAEQGEQQERAYWVGRQLRDDVAHLALSGDGHVPAVRLLDGEGRAQLSLLVRDMRGPTLVRVHYSLDGDGHTLSREAASPWAAEGGEKIQWQMAGEVTAFQVLAMNAAGEWLGDWDYAAAGLPAAFRIRWKPADGSERELTLPVVLGNR